MLGIPVTRWKWLMIRAAMKQYVLCSKKPREEEDHKHGSRRAWMKMHGALRILSQGPHQRWQRWGCFWNIWQATQPGRRWAMFPNTDGKTGSKARSCGDGGCRQNRCWQKAWFWLKWSIWLIRGLPPWKFHLLQVWGNPRTRGWWVALVPITRRPQKPPNL